MRHMITIHVLKTEGVDPNWFHSLNVVRPEGLSG